MVWFETTLKQLSNLTPVPSTLCIIRLPVQVVVSRNPQGLRNPRELLLPETGKKKNFMAPTPDRIAGKIRRIIETEKKKNPQKRKRGLRMLILFLNMSKSREKNLPRPGPTRNKRASGSSAPWKPVFTRAWPLDRGFTTSRLRGNIWLRGFTFSKLSFLIILIVRSVGFYLLQIW